MCHPLMKSLVFENFDFRIRYNTPSCCWSAVRSVTYYVQESLNKQLDSKVTFLSLFTYFVLFLRICFSSSSDFCPFFWGGGSKVTNDTRCCHENLVTRFQRVTSSFTYPQFCKIHYINCFEQLEGHLTKKTVTNCYIVVYFQKQGRLHSTDSCRILYTKPKKKLIKFENITK